MGTNVTTPKIGDRVGIAWLHSSCGHCEHCLEGYESLCEGQQNSGYSVNGALAEYAIGTASHCIPIPNNVSYDQAAPLLCAGVTTYKALKETGCKAGDFVAIMGAGGGLGTSLSSSSHRKFKLIKTKNTKFIKILKRSSCCTICKSNGLSSYCYRSRSG